MKVFISWSGEASRELAIALRKWFPKVLQDVRPFVSEKDIDKGDSWAVVLRKELADSSFGVVCLTPENMFSPWLNYEAGAISTSMDARVCPVLLGVKKDQVKPPLSQLQLTELTEEDMSLLMMSMNKADGSLLESPAIRENVEMWWKQLEDATSSIAVPDPGTAIQSSPEPPQPKTPIEENIEELLRRTTRIEKRLIIQQRDVAHEESDSAVEVANLLYASGLAVEMAKRLPDGRIEVLVKELPYPLPKTVASVLLSQKRDEGRLVVLKDKNGHSVSFERDSRDEPPF